jgi:hypothetical protein
MRTLKVFIEGLTQYLKHQGKTIAGFGTFSELTKSKQKTASIEAVDEKWTEGVKTTQRDNSENTRLQKKVEQLLELAGFANSMCCRASVESGFGVSLVVSNGARSQNTLHVWRKPHD